METQSRVENKNNDVQTSQNMFTRANILANESKIRLVDFDKDTGLDLFCYNRCCNEEDEFIKQCRGLVFHGDTLVMKAFSYTDEYSHTDSENLNRLFTNFGKWSFYTAYEGALIRLFYFSGKWYLSTHRKLNAFRSKWSSRDSFGTLFKRALEHEVVVNKSFSNRLANTNGENILERFQSTLNKNMQYMFLLRNSSDNRIVCDPPTVKDTLVLHVGTFVNNTLSMTEDIGLNYPSHHTFTDLNDLVNFVNTKVNPKSVQGIFCFGPENQQLKVLHSDYMQMFHVRGNEPSLKFRYLQVRMDKKVTDMLYNLYPDNIEVFNDYENTIYDIAHLIYRAYVERFIKKHYVTMPREEYQVINECHSWHLADRQNNRVNLDHVIQVLNKQSPTNINHMIRRFKLEQMKKQSQIPRTAPSTRNNSNVNSPVNNGLIGPEPTVLRSRTAV